MADVTSPTRPACLVATVDQIARRIIILRTDPNPSAQMCAHDANVALDRWEREEPWTFGESDHLPQSFLESAAMWTDRGRAHAFGFITPEGWA